MNIDHKKLESQLWDWRLRIDRLAIKTHKAGGKAGFDATMKVDELKVMHAIAQAKYNEFWASGELKRLRLIPELKGAWNDLKTAFEDLGPQDPGEADPQVQQGYPQPDHPRVDSRKRGNRT